MKPVFRHITVPVDGSSTSQRGMAFAVELAQGGGALTICSVVDPAVVSMPAVVGVALDPGAMLATLDEDAALFCDRAAALAPAHGVALDSLVLHGSCAESIKALSAHNGSDAIVIGTHGRTGLARAMMGSIAEALERQSDIPVVAVHEDDEMRTGPVLVAIDDSPAAQAALESAIAVATARSIRLTLVNVRSPSGARATASAALEAAALSARSHGVETTVMVRSGSAAVEILDLAERLEACMIVVGTHGRALLARLVLGSVAAALLERARIPVITVRRAA